MNLFTPKEIEEFAKKKLFTNNEEEFAEFYATCAERAKEETKFQLNMYFIKVAEILAIVVLPIWGAVEVPSDKQIALMNLTNATCHELFDQMVNELMEKNKDKENLN